VNVMSRAGHETLAPNRIEEARRSPVEETRRRFHCHELQVDLNRVPLVRSDVRAVPRKGEAALVVGRHDLLEVSPTEVFSASHQGGEQGIDRCPTRSVEDDARLTGRMAQRPTKQPTDPSALG